MKTNEPPGTLHTDDMALLRRIAAQEGHAFDAFYAQYAPRLRGYLGRLLSDQTLVDDVCHDVLLIVWQQAGRFPATVPLWAWLCGIARHRARKAWAHTCRALAPAGPVDSKVATPEALLLQQESERVLDRALDTLPYHERTALVLLVQHGCSYQGIATAMETPVSTVRTRVSRACQRLRARVAAEGATSPSPDFSPNS